MKIAILGTRGIPNRYGGFEAFAEKLSFCLAERGHEVTVYCRRPFTRPGDEKLIDSRIRRVILPSISAKHLDTPFNGLLAALHVSFTRAEVILMCNVGNSPVCWIPRLFGKPLALNVDGLDRQRKKWGWLASAYLHFCEWLSVRTPTRVVTDARTVRDYYRSRYGKESAMIAYGAAVPEQAAIAREGSAFARLGLEPKQYILYVSRLEPENNPELVLRGYQLSKSEWPLVVVGDNDYRPGYVEQLRKLAGDRVIFTGSIYGDGYWELQRNAGLFIFACEVGGIHPALIETMACGNAALYLDTESNRETAGEHGLAFEHDERSLAQEIERLIHDPELRSRLGRSAAEYARQNYGWEQVTEKYEALFAEMLK
ncbi:MAG TPA: glycosyltransferase [Terriglobales bacterium]|nr:glycosyltransferase [Terriglobales bacterium]